MLDRVRHKDHVEALRSDLSRFKRAGSDIESAPPAGNLRGSLARLDAGDVWTAECANRGEQLTGGTADIQHSCRWAKKRPVAPDQAATLEPLNASRQAVLAEWCVVVRVVHRELGIRRSRVEIAMTAFPTADQLERVIRHTGDEVAKYDDRFGIATAAKVAGDVDQRLTLARLSLNHRAVHRLPGQEEQSDRDDAGRGARCTRAVSRSRRSSRPATRRRPVALRRSSRARRGSAMGGCRSGVP